MLLLLFSPYAHERRMPLLFALSSFPAMPYYYVIFECDAILRAHTDAFSHYARRHARFHAIRSPCCCFIYGYATISITYALYYYIVMSSSDYMVLFLLFTIYDILRFSSLLLSSTIYDSSMLYYIYHTYIRYIFASILLYYYAIYDVCFIYFSEPSQKPMLFFYYYDIYMLLTVIYIYYIKESYRANDSMIEKYILYQELLSMSCSPLYYTPYTYI